MAMTRILTNIPDDEVSQVVADFESEGAQVEQVKENGTWRVTAEFPDSASTFRPVPSTPPIAATPGSTHGDSSPLPARVQALASDYEALFDSCVIRADRTDDVDRQVQRLLDGRGRYETVGSSMNVPWWFIGTVHSLESSFDLNTHLHNGDPLTARTTNVPRGRPETGNPPFSWEESAKDAIKHQELDQWTHWSNLAGVLFKWEEYNGFGYHSRQMNSPYLWSFTNHYEKGKFIADGQFDPDAVSKQCGAAAILRALVDRSIVSF